MLGCTAGGSVYIRIVLCAAFVGACGGRSPQVQQSISAVLPAIVNPGAATSMTVDGRFEVVANAASTVTFVRTRSLDGVPDGRDVASVKLTSTTSGFASRIELSLPPSETPTGVYGFRITSGAGNTVSVADGFVMAPPATATPLPTDVVCLRGDAPMQLTFGLANFYMVLDQAPAISLDGSFRGQPALGGCEPVQFAGTAIEKCASASVTLPADSSSGEYRLTVTTAPSDGLSGSILDQTFIVDRADPLNAVPGVVYSAVDADAPLSFSGIRTYHVDSAAPPAATVDGKSVVPAFDSCFDSNVPGHSFCNRMSLALPRGTPGGLHTVALTTTPGCTVSTTALSIDAPAPASVHSDDPSLPTGLYCPNVGRFLVVEGSGFQAPQVFVDGVPTVTINDCPQGAPGTCSSFSFFVLASLSPPSGAHTVEVENRSVPPVRRALPAPVVFDPGPASTWPPQPSLLANALERKVFVPVSRQTGAIATVALQGPGGSAFLSTFSVAPGGIVVTVPAGLTPGIWFVVVRDQSLCPPAQGSVLEIAADFVFIDRTFDGDTAGPPVIFEGDTAPSANADLVANGSGFAAHFADGVAAPPWWFVATSQFGGVDAATLRFDLRRSGSGNPLGGSDVQLSSSNVRLETALSPPPQDAWTHYDVPLDDPSRWTYVGLDGSTRPATADDLATFLFVSNSEVRIRGSGFDGATDASLDNVVVELVH